MSAGAATLTRTQVALLFACCRASDLLGTEDSVPREIVLRLCAFFGQTSWKDTLIRPLVRMDYLHYFKFDDEYMIIDTPLPPASRITGKQPIALDDDALARLCRRTAEPWSETTPAPRSPSASLRLIDEELAAAVVEVENLKRALFLLQAERRALADLSERLFGENLDDEPAADLLGSNTLEPARRSARIHTLVTSLFREAKKFPPRRGKRHPTLDIYDDNEDWKSYREMVDPEQG